MYVTEILQKVTYCIVHVISHTDLTSNKHAYTVCTVTFNSQTGIHLNDKII